MEPIHAKGTSAQVEFDGAAVVIRRGKVSAKLVGMKAEKVVPLADIRQVDFRQAGKFRGGYIRFAVPGFTKDPVYTDHNGVDFMRSDEAAFVQLRDAVESALSTRGPIDPARVAELEADAAAQIHAILKKADVAVYGLHIADHKGYRHGLGPTHDIAGANAEFESGADRSRPTLTRIGAGALLAGPIGAVAGGMFKKEKSKGYVTITFPDGAYVIVDGPAKDEKKMREFANAVTQIGAANARQSVLSVAQISEPEGTELSVADQLLKLKELEKAGVLSEEQYAEKAAPLIARL